MSAHRIIDFSWLGMALLWLVTALSTKRAVRREFSAARAFQVALLVIGFLLMFSDELAVGPLAFRLVPRSFAASAIALTLTLSGFGITLWARFFLGRNWSAAITIKQDHQLIRTGPYAFVRHPIYSGFLLALLGTAIGFGQGRHFIGFVLCAIGWRLKSLTEERFLTEQFPGEYPRYRREVKALVPFIW